VAIIDTRPFGGTCALRGCHPKKMLVSAGEAIDAVHRMTGKGVRAREVGIDWAALPWENQGLSQGAVPGPEQCSPS
jgi:glutathione reductase (NADPH)